MVFLIYKVSFLPSFDTHASVFEQKECLYEKKQKLKPVRVHKFTTTVAVHEVGVDFKTDKNEIPNTKY